MENKNTRKTIDNIDIQVVISKLNEIFEGKLKIRENGTNFDPQNKDWGCDYYNPHSSKNDEFVLRICEFTFKQVIKQEVDFLSKETHIYPIK